MSFGSVAEHARFSARGMELALVLLVVACCAFVVRSARADNNILIDPDQEEISATSYYPTFGQIPSKMADNSGLSFSLPTGTPIPASDLAYPTHDTVLADMYRSGKDTHPDLFFSLDGGYALSGLHYWNFNGDNRASHPTGGDRETPSDGINSVDIAVSTAGVAGPYTTVGTYALQQAPAQADYTGLTLPLGLTAGAKFVRFHVNTNFSGAGPDTSGYFGLSEIRFIGQSYEGDVNTDGAVDFADLLTLAQHYGLSGATRSLGDLNSDEAVGFSDLLLLAQHYGEQFGIVPQVATGLASVASVPAPTTLALLPMVFGALLLRRRRPGGQPTRVLPRSAAVLAMIAAGLTCATLRAGQIEPEVIDPNEENAIASSYYPVVDASPQKAVDNSGLSFALNQGDAIPAVWPSHDTLLTHMYWSGTEVAPTLAFTLPGTFEINSLHYWNYNEPGDSGHGGGSRDGPSRGMQNVTVSVSTQSLTGPYTVVGTYQFQEASGTPSYTGVTLPLGTTVTARYVRFQVNSDWGGDFSGLSEVRFLGGSEPGDADLDGAVNFSDLLILAQHFGTASGATVAQGDFNRDGKVDFSDLLILGQNYGQSLSAGQLAQLSPQFQSQFAAAEQIPEPTSLGLFALAMLPALQRTRRAAP